MHDNVAGHVALVSYLIKYLQFYKLVGTLPVVKITYVTAIANFEHYLLQWLLEL